MDNRTAIAAVDKGDMQIRTARASARKFATASWIRFLLKYWNMHLKMVFFFVCRVTLLSLQLLDKRFFGPLEGIIMKFVICF